MPHLFPSFDPPRGTTLAQWGELQVEEKSYQPLETVVLWVGPGASGATRYRVEWFDGLGQRYGWHEGRFDDSTERVEFLAGGAPGMQFVRLWLDGSEQPCRLVNFYLAAETRLTTGDHTLDVIYPLSHEAMRLNRRRYQLDGGSVVGYTTADSVQTLAYWLRDMLYNLPGYMLWEQDVASGYAAILRRQHDDGSLPDGVRADGSTWRMITESDVEYLAMLAVYRTWLITGDEAWLAEHLPAADRALEHLLGSPLRWDPEQQFVVRAHTCDTWDFSIYDGDRYDATTPKVASLCDQTGYYQALCARAEIEEQRAGGHPAKAQEWRERAERFRLLAADRLWDGEKFQHHLHLGEFDHGSFDETRQLAMSNTWALTRGFATVDQGARIVNTYRRRQTETGDPYPWWSLQPGYPHQDYPFLARNSYQHTGGYCNGGLMPWVGGALAHGSFVCGESPYGVELLRDYGKFLSDRDGEIYTWYWPNGEPGFRTGNTTGHDGWGMGHWVAALFEGLCGLELTAPAMRRVTLSPRWAATDRNDVTCIAALPASEAYTAYRWRARPGAALDLTVTSSGESIDLHVLLPETAHLLGATVNGENYPATETAVGMDRYAELTLTEPGVTQVVVYLRRASDED